MKTKKHAKRPKPAPTKPPTKPYQQREENPATGGPFAALFRYVATAAAEKQLFVLAEGHPRVPAWRFHDRASGKRVLTYLPHARLIVTALESTPCGEWLEAVAMAAAWRDAGKFVGD